MSALPAQHRELSPQLFSTRITEMFGIRHPILCGGLMWLADASYVAGIVNAGGMGFITSRSSTSIELFQAELARCRTLTAGRAFGVNLSTSRHSEVPLLAYLETALECGVRHFETAGKAPADLLIRRIKDAGGLVLHKVPLVRHAETAERLGVDAVAIIGMESGGYPGINTEIPTMLGGAMAAGRLTIPFAIGGGIGTGRQLLGALALGADAVVMGTRFLASQEVWAHAAYKQRIILADERNSVVAFSTTPSLGGAWRVLDNATAREVRRREASGLQTYDDYAPLISGALTRDGCYAKGDPDCGMVSMGPAACFVTRTQTIAEIVTEIITEADAYRSRLDGLRT